MRKQPPFTRRARTALILMLIGLVLFFVAAWQIHPYDVNGQARRSQTHVQLGLPPCSFHRVTGKPCPSCGLTTSVALTSRGDIGNAVRANAVGTLLAFYFLLLIPWAVLSLKKNRALWVGTLERLATWTVLTFLLLAVLRWAIVIGLPWWQSA